MDYVMSDIHGMSEEFFRMIELIDFKETDNMYIIGDVVDRGFRGIKVLRYIMEHKNITLMMGNHEHMMVEAFSGSKEMERIWVNNGGLYTIEELKKLTDVEFKGVMEYLEERPYINVVGKYILCHAMIDILGDTFGELIAIQDRDTILWGRDFEGFLSKKIPEDYIVIFGHTPTKFIYNFEGKTKRRPMRIWKDKKFKDKIGIDCGACFDGGQLACLRLDDLKEYYVERIE